jgi:hypothetical protein
MVTSRVAILFGSFSGLIKNLTILAKYLEQVPRFLLTAFQKIAYSIGCKIVSPARILIATSSVLSAMTLVVLPPLPGFFSDLPRLKSVPNFNGFITEAATPTKKKHLKPSRTIDERDLFRYDGEK